MHLGKSSLNLSMSSPRQNFKVEVDAKDTEDDLGYHCEAVGGDEDPQDNGNGIVNITRLCNHMFSLCSVWLVPFTLDDCVQSRTPPCDHAWVLWRRR